MKKSNVIVLTVLLIASSTVGAIGEQNRKALKALLFLNSTEIKGRIDSENYPQFYYAEFPDKYTLIQAVYNNATSKNLEKKALLAELLCNGFTAPKKKNQQTK